jgi:hypothetical protein
MSAGMLDSYTYDFLDTGEAPAAALEVLALPVPELPPEELTGDTVIEALLRDFGGRMLGLKFGAAAGGVALDEALGQFEAESRAMAEVMMGRPDERAVCAVMAYANELFDLADYASRPGIRDDEWSEKLDTALQVCARSIERLIAPSAAAVAPLAPTPVAAPPPSRARALPAQAEAPVAPPAPRLLDFVERLRSVR